MFAPLPDIVGYDLEEKDILHKRSRIEYNNLDLKDESLGVLTNETLYQTCGRSNVREVKPEDPKPEIKKSEEPKKKEWLPIPKALKNILSTKQQYELKDRMRKVKLQRQPIVISPKKDDQVDKNINPSPPKPQSTQ